MTTTQQIINKFVSSVDVNKTYTTAELVSLLKSATKTGNKKTTANGEPKVKKAPSEYNIFIQKQMELLKNNGTSPKDRMREATSNWNKYKEQKQQEAKSESPVESD
jgi:hypothetical protein